MLYLIAAFDFKQKRVQDLAADTENFVIQWSPFSDTLKNYVRFQVIHGHTFENANHPERVELISVDASNWDLIDSM